MIEIGSDRFRRESTPATVTLGFPRKGIPGKAPGGSDVLAVGLVWRSVNRRVCAHDARSAPSVPRNQCQTRSPAHARATPPRPHAPAWGFRSHGSGQGSESAFSPAPEGVHVLWPNLHKHWAGEHVSTWRLGRKGLDILQEDASGGPGPAWERRWPRQAFHVLSPGLHVTQGPPRQAVKRMGGAFLCL